MNHSWKTFIDNMDMNQTNNLMKRIANVSFICLVITGKAGMNPSSRKKRFMNLRTTFGFDIEWN